MKSSARNRLDDFGVTDLSILLRMALTVGKQSITIYIHVRARAGLRAERPG